MSRTSGPPSAAFIQTFSRCLHQPLGAVGVEQLDLILARKALVVLLRRRLPPPPCHLPAYEYRCRSMDAVNVGPALSRAEGGPSFMRT